MKKELLCMAGVLYWAALVAIILPALLSADSTELVLAGLAILVASTYATYRVIRRIIRKGINP